MANIDRILNIHQSYSLSKVSALNKQILVAQYAQIQQISKLEKELKQSNEISRKILDNQLRELKHKENLKYYKELAYNMHDAISIIEKGDNTLLKSFLCEIYLTVIVDNIEVAKSNVEEIADKDFCGKTLERIEVLKNSVVNSQAEYSNSDFKRMLDCKCDFDALSKELRKQQYILSRIRSKEPNADKSTMERWLAEQEAKEKSTLKPLGNKGRGCVIKILWVLLALFVLLSVLAAFDDLEVTLAMAIIFILPISVILLLVKRADNRWRKNYSQYLDDFNAQQNPPTQSPEEEEQQRVIESIEVQLSEHQYNHFKRAISNDIPNWEDVVEKIFTLLPQSAKEAQPQIDMVVLDVARYFVKNQKASVSAIQRNFEVGFNRAGRIMQELENLRVVGSQNIGGGRELLVRDMDSLDLILFDYIEKQQ